MKELEIQIRGKTTRIKYAVKRNMNLVHADVTWINGNRTTFYKGMYGNPDRWETKNIPDDLIVLLSAVFEKEIPEVQGAFTNHGYVPNVND